MQRARMVRVSGGIGVALVTILLVSGCGGESGEGGVIELSFGHVGAPGSLFAVSAEEFARRANAELAGRVQVNVFGSSQLGSDEIMLQKLKLGTLGFALPSTIMSSTVDAFGLFEMPYLVQDRAHMRRIEEAIVWPVLVPKAEERAYTILAIWENGFRHVTNNTRPVVTPSDLSGIKLRTPRGIWRVKLFQAFGANPTRQCLFPRSSLRSRPASWTARRIPWRRSTPPSFRKCRPISLLPAMCTPQRT